MTLQFREPQPYALTMLSSYARYVARHLPHELDPKVPVKSVKIYRVTHDILAPAQLAERRSPVDPRLYYAYFQGEYDADGTLINPDDPFLYWLLPMVYVPRDWPKVPFDADLPMEQMRLLDCVKMHAEYRPLEPKKP
jgi:hypothetical protein